MKLKTILLGTSLAIVAATGSNAATLTTTFAHNNGQAGNMFDIMTGGSDLTIESLALNLDSGDHDVELYVRTGTYVGNEGSAAGWTLAGSATLASAGDGNATAWDIADLFATANTRYGIYVTVTNGNGINYTNGAGAVGDVVASDGNLTIYEGVGVSYPLGSTFTTRIWNGSINYSVDSVSAAVPLPAGFPLLAAGLFGLGLMRRRKS